MDHFDRDKFRALVLYVIWRTGEVRDFGTTKLNKVLWFSDARAFEAYGRSITGETYVRQKFGPVPRDIVSVLKELQDEGLIQAWSEPFFDFEVIRYRAHEPPATSLFTADELGLIDWWIKHIAEQHTAASISETSHDYAWKIAKMGEELPFHAFLASRIRQPRDEELEWAKSAADQLGSK
jgi:Protein of unknown function (DUF4065)